MTKYKNLHLWMIIPMVIMQAGIFRDYWGDFSENAWSVHVHYLTGTVWYFYLIIQPYFATHGQLARHRTNGIIGMFLAGAVCLTALSMMHRDIVSAERSATMREQFGPFEPWFFMGVACRGNSNDVGFWICCFKKHYSSQTIGKSFMVAYLNCIYYYDACTWTRHSNCTCWNAGKKLAQCRDHAFALFYRRVDNCYVTFFCMEI
jgi:hypothetical protein